MPDNREGWPFGMCVHQLIQEEGPATDAFDELGAPWVRIDANWNEIEPAEGSFDWTAMDRMVGTARAHGAIVYATLAYTPAWATDGAVRSGVPRSPDYYRAFVTAVAGRYKDRVKHWGLWNEPEGGRFWAGTAQQLIDLVLRPGFEAVRAADPGALVLGPDSGSDEWLDDIFSAGGGDYLDIITVHVYACCDSTDNVAKVLRRLDCTGALPWDPCRRKAIVNNGLGGKPVWLTEAGWKTLSAEWEGKQALYYTGLLDAMLERPWWKKTVFYELYDAAPCDPGLDNCWGIIRPDWSRKPAFEALRSYIAAHQVRAEAGPDQTAEPGAAVVFDGSSSWDPDGTVERYRWDFDRTDGVFAEAEGATVSHPFETPGAYTVTLVVTDNHGLEDADTLTVSVGGVPARPTIRAMRVLTPPSIDGRLDDWRFLRDVQVGTGDYVELTAPSSGDADLSGRVLMAWDDANLYVAVVITDDVHANDNTPDGMWLGDSLQIAFDADLDRTTPYDADGDTEAGFALLAGGAATARWTAPALAPAWNPVFASAPGGTGQIVIEAAIPFAQLPPFAPSLGAVMGMSFLINDDDGSGREGFVQWTEGIGRGKDPSKFGDLVLAGGPCEADLPCAVAADCAEAPPACECGGGWTCNGAGMCEWICGAPVEEEPSPNGEDEGEEPPAVNDDAPDGGADLEAGPDPVDGSADAPPVEGGGAGGGCGCALAG